MQSRHWCTNSMLRNPPWIITEAVPAMTGVEALMPVLSEALPTVPAQRVTGESTLSTTIASPAAQPEQTQVTQTTLPTTESVLTESGSTGASYDSSTQSSKPTSTTQTQNAAAPKSIQTSEGSKQSSITSSTPTSTSLDATGSQVSSPSSDGHSAHISNVTTTISPSLGVLQAQIGGSSALIVSNQHSAVTLTPGAAAEVSQLEISAGASGRTYVSSDNGALVTITASTTDNPTNVEQASSSCGVARYIASTLGGLAATRTTTPSSGVTTDASNPSSDQTAISTSDDQLQSASSSRASTGGSNIDGTSITAVMPPASTSVAIPGQSSIDITALPGNVYLVSNTEETTTLSAGESALTLDGEIVTAETNGVVLDSGSWSTTIARDSSTESSIYGTASPSGSNESIAYIVSTVSNGVNVLEGSTRTWTLSAGGPAATLSGNIASVGSSGLTTFAATSTNGFLGSASTSEQSTSAGTGSTAAASTSVSESSSLSWIAITTALLQLFLWYGYL
jgi:hypothetical protein